MGLDNLPSRRRSKQPEQLQINPGKETPAGKAAKAVEPAATPKSGKKQVTKPEKRVEAMDSSQSESEEPAEAKSGRGRKRKSEDTPTASEKKAKKGKAKKGEEGEEPETTFSDYDSAG